MIRYLGPIGLAFAFAVVALSVAIPLAQSHRGTVTTTSTNTVTVAPSKPTGSYRGVSARGWSAKFHAMRRLAYRRLVHAKRLRRVLLANPHVLEAIALAGVVYGQTTTLLRVARCESKLQVYARNNSSADSPRNIFQFMPSTWATTPYRAFSIWSPYAAALAAGWMRTHGRTSEWACT